MRALFIFAILAITAASQSGLTLVRTTDLKADTHHVQGIDFDAGHIWVTSVAKEHHQGYLQEFALASGEHLRTVEVTAGVRFHPGGISADGEHLWLPVAEYRRASSSVIQKRNLRTLQLESQFDVADHIGCIAAAPGELIGANWDSRDFYVWDQTGRLLRKVPNPTPNAYQDIKFVDGGLVASGLLPDHTGAIDWLEYPSLRLIRRVAAGKSSRGVPYTSEGMAIRGSRVYLLPEDSPSRLFEFNLTDPALPPARD
uniref:Glutamine cyclotransferase n=1 Tax=Solibacter usitatus (strain Ellin6076) TaxID=234267 RepID=Q02AC9_SOLUE